MKNFEWLCLRAWGSSDKLGLSPALRFGLNQMAEQKPEMKILNFPFRLQKPAQYKRKLSASEKAGLTYVHVGRCPTSLLLGPTSSHPLHREVEGSKHECVCVSSCLPTSLFSVQSSARRRPGTVVLLCFYADTLNEQSRCSTRLSESCAPDAPRVFH